MRKFEWIRTAKQIMELGLSEVPTLMDPLMPKSGVMALAGSSDLGKSYLILQLMVHIVKGEKDFLGFPLNVSHKRAIYLSTEDDDYSLCPRLINMQRQTGAHLEEYNNIHIIYEIKNLVDRLDEVLCEYPCDLVGIDTFADIYDGDMNQTNKVRSFLQPFKELANKHKTLILFNHHCGKRNDIRPPHKDNLLGSQGFESSMRSVIELRKDFGDSGKRHICVVKGNYISEEFKNESYEVSFDYLSGFQITGERVAFNMLAKSTEIAKSETVLENRILDLRKTGLSISQVSDVLMEGGVQVSRSKVGLICKKLKSIQKHIEEGMDG